MIKEIYKEIKCDSWRDFKSQMENLSDDSHSMWIFRGQQNPNWTLKTSLERVCDRFPGSISFSRALIEQQLLEEFKKSAPNFLEGRHLPTTDQEWFALMQHHGAPTRYLDFTHSPFIAAFFGCSDAYESFSESFAVWAIDAGWLQRCLLEVTRKNHMKKHVESDSSTIEKDFNFNNILEEIIDEKLKTLIPMPPPTRNQRLMVQQGTFVIPGDIESSFMDNFSCRKSPRDKEPVRKYVISMNDKATIMRDLLLMNISASILFPDLDGFCRSLNFYPLNSYRKVFGGYLDELLKRKSGETEDLNA